MQPSYDQELQTAIQAVSAASDLCARIRQNLVTEDAITKSDRSPVTIADYASQAVVNQALREAFPEDLVVGEEDAALLRDPEQQALLDTILTQTRPALGDINPSDLFALIEHGAGDARSAERFWTIDPIDGTKGFLRNDQYAVALALIEQGEVVLGVLGCPNLPGDGDQPGKLFWAVRGSGSSSRDLAADTFSPLSVSPEAAPAEMAFCESVESGHSAHGHSAQIAEKLGVTRESVRLDSQAKYAVVARGEAEAYLRLPTRADYQEKIWDHAAGMLVVEEAGGRVTDIHGKKLDFSLGHTLAENKGVVATNGLDDSLP